jgi:hypothetical protein
MLRIYSSFYNIFYNFSKFWIREQYPQPILKFGSHRFHRISVNSAVFVNPTSNTLRQTREEKCKRWERECKNPHPLTSVAFLQRGKSSSNCRCRRCKPALLWVLAELSSRCFEQFALLSPTQAHTPPSLCRAAAGDQGLPRWGRHCPWRWMEMCELDLRETSRCACSSLEVSKHLLLPL